MNVPEAAPPLRVLFVCTANICRSAYAEQLARHLLDQSVGRDGGADDTANDSVAFTSAGTHGWTDHPVEAAMATELSRRGVSADGFASRPMTMRMVDEADLVLTAARSHRQFILDDRPAAVWRTFTVGQFARIVDELPEELTGRELIAGCRR
ncbi:MAG TPA: hypothetical protein VFM50_07115, partial [Nocardioidaceae bacterium]|nr:hypothetical protein [Nocardioidaceae bacterium]